MKSTRRKKIIIFILILVVVFYVIPVLYLTLKGGSIGGPAYSGKVNITEVTGLEKLDGLNLIASNNAPWIVWGSGTSWNDSFYQLHDASATPLEIGKDFYPPNPIFFGKSTDIASHMVSPAAYALRMRTVGTPNFVMDDLGNQYLISTNNNPSGSLVYRITNGIAQPLFDAPNIDLDFSPDNAGSFYAFIANTLTGETGIYKVKGDSLSEVKNLRNGYDHFFYIDGPDRSYVVLTNSKGSSYDEPHVPPVISSVYQIVGDHGVKVNGLGIYNEGVTVTFDGKGNTYLTAKSETGSDYYKVAGTVATKIAALPDMTAPSLLSQAVQNAPQFQGKRYQTYGDDLGNVYAVVVASGEPFWNCDVYRIEGDMILPVKNIALRSVSCSGMYTDKKGHWFVIDRGDIYGGSKTHAYWLDKDQASDIRDFEDMRYLEMSYDKAENFWYGKTQADRGPKAVANDFETHLYKIIFD